MFFNISYEICFFFFQIYFIFLDSDCLSWNFPYILVTFPRKSQLSQGGFLNTSFLHLSLYLQFYLQSLSEAVQADFLAKDELRLVFGLIQMFSQFDVGHLQLLNLCDLRRQLATHCRNCTRKLHCELLCSRNQMEINKDVS